jgi:uncharacterized protein Veg
VVYLSDKNTLVEIKQVIDRHIGEKVRLKTNGGRKKTIIKEGVIEETYPSIFIVKVDMDNSVRHLSYSYSDILTETVELSLCNKVTN